MRRKPDLVLALVVAFGLGVMITGFTQNFAEPQPYAAWEEPRQ